jgi:saccharopepsin
MHLVPLFFLFPLCSGAVATIPIKRTTIRFKFDDWRLFNKHVGAFQQPNARVPRLLAEFTYGSRADH